MSQESIAVSQLTKKQQKTYNSYKEIYPNLLESIRPFYLKILHYEAQNQIYLEQSDSSLIALLDPEPKNITAIDVYQRFKADNTLELGIIHILLPYIILEVASNNYEKFNQHNSFYELVDQTKICFTENTYEECRAKTILIIEISI